ncbi:MAG: roadblock/LC7 domain-containing protein [Promethearchaeota archaeon]
MSQEKIISNLEKVIQEFTDNNSEVQGQILIAYPQGVPLVNTWEKEFNPIIVGALSAAVKLTFQNLCVKLHKGNLKRLFMNSENGRVIIQNTGGKAILTTIIDKEADVARIAFEMSNLSLIIEKLLKEFDYDKILVSL